MDGNGGNSNRITSIRQIVKFKEFVKKWQLVALSPGSKSCSATPSKSGGISPEVSWQLRNCESDEESHHSVEMPPSDVPKGYLAVYVGPESDVRRFIIPTTYLSDPLFKVLLQKVEEEFGFDHTGGLTIPCDIETFKYLLECMKNHRKEEAHHTNAGQGQTSSSV